MFAENLIHRHRTAVAAAVYFVLTVALTYPLVFHLQDHLIGTGTADVWQFPWNNFIFRERVLAGKDPYFTDRIYHPVGTSLLLHTNTEINSVLGLVLHPVLSEVGQMNVGLLLSGFLSALGTYLLTYRLTGFFVGALFAGIAFAFCPFRITRYFGHINFALTQAIPFALWAFLRMGETHKFRYALLTGLFFAIAYYSNQYYMMFLIISFAFLTVYGLWKIPSFRTAKFIKNLVFSGLIAGVLLAQVGWHFLQDRRDKVIAEHNAGGGLAAKGSAYLSDYFIPGPMSGVAYKIYGIKYNGPHYKTTTGLITILLAFAGLIAAIRQKNQPLVAIGLLGVLFLLITLGPWVDVGNFRVPLPYRLLMEIPYMNHVRLPYRAAPMVALGFAVMAGFAVSLLNRPGMRWRPVIVTALFCALIFELTQAPLKLSKFNVPEVFQRMEKMEAGSILTLPLENNVANAAHQMKYQLVHKKDLLNGRTARATPLRRQQAYIQRIPVVQSFEGITRTHGRMGMLKHLEEDQEAASAFRQFFNVRYLAIHDRYAPREDVKKYVSSVFPDAKILYDGPTLRVYQLPKIQEHEMLPDDALPFFLFSGWKPKPRKIAIGLENQVKMVLPHVERNQTLSMDMQIRSRDEGALNGGKAIIKMKDDVLMEVPLKKKFEKIQLSIPGKEVLDKRSLLKIELVGPENRLLDFYDSVTPKLELQLLRVRIH